MSCYAILCSAILFLGWNGGTVLHHQSEQEVIALCRMLLKQLWCHTHVCLFVFICKQVENPAAAAVDYLISHSCFNLLYGMMSCAKLCYNFPVTFQSSLMIASTFCSLHLVVVLLGLPQHRWSMMSVFSLLKCFTHLLKAPMQESPYKWWSSP